MDDTDHQSLPHFLEHPASLARADRGAAAPTESAENRLGIKAPSITGIIEFYLCHFRTAVVSRNSFDPTCRQSKRSLQSLVLVALTANTIRVAFDIVKQLNQYHHDTLLGGKIAAHKLTRQLVFAASALARIQSRCGSNGCINNCLLPPLFYEHNKLQA